MKTFAKALLLSSLVLLLSACASSRYGTYDGYSGNDYNSGYNYPDNGYYPPAYPYGNVYQRYPANPAYRGYNGPYYGGNPNNNNYYNRNQPRPIPAPPGFYRRNPPAQVHHHHENNYYYGRPPYNQGGWQGGNRQAPNAPPAVGRWQAQQQPQQPQRNWGGQRNWQRRNNQPFDQPNGGEWRAQNRQQQPVVRIQNNGGNVNFGRITDRMGQQPVQPGRNRAFWQRKRRGQDD